MSSEKSLLTGLQSEILAIGATAVNLDSQKVRLEQQRQEIDARIAEIDAQIQLATARISSPEFQLMQLLANEEVFFNELNAYIATLGMLNSLKENPLVSSPQFIEEQYQHVTQNFATVISKYFENLKESVDAVVLKEIIQRIIELIFVSVQANIPRQLLVSTLLDVLSKNESKDEANVLENSLTKEEESVSSEMSEVDESSESVVVEQDDSSEEHVESDEKKIERILSRKGFAQTFLKIILFTENYTVSTKTIIKETSNITEKSREVIFYDLRKKLRDRFGIIANLDSRSGEYSLDSIDENLAEKFRSYILEHLQSKPDRAQMQGVETITDEGLNTVIEHEENPEILSAPFTPEVMIDTLYFFKPHTDVIKNLMSVNNLTPEQIDEYFASCAQLRAQIEDSVSFDAHGDVLERRSMAVREVMSLVTDEARLWEVITSDVVNDLQIKLLIGLSELESFLQANESLMSFSEGDIEEYGYRLLKFVQSQQVRDELPELFYTANRFLLHRTEVLGLIGRQHGIFSEVRVLLAGEVASEEPAGSVPSSQPDLVSKPIESEVNYGDEQLSPASLPEDDIAESVEDSEVTMPAQQKEVKKNKNEVLRDKLIGEAIKELESNGFVINEFYLATQAINISSRKSSLTVTAIKNNEKYVPAEQMQKNSRNGYTEYSFAALVTLMVVGDQQIRNQKSNFKNKICARVVQILSEQRR